MPFRVVLKNARIKTGRIRAAAYEAVAAVGLDATKTFDEEEPAAAFCEEIRTKAGQEFEPEKI